MQCGICGGEAFTNSRILWDRLINEWQLSPVEVTYIDRQQGTTCNQCGANLRSIALANALRSFLGTQAFLREATTSPRGKSLAILEINETGALTPILKAFGHYCFGAYPEIDIQALPYADSTFDVVIHS